MKANFEIIDNYALQIDDRHIDLHNNFDFAGYSYDSEKEILILNWKQSKGDWVAKDELKALSLVHKMISYLRIEKEKGSVQDDDCLGDLSYYPASDRNDNECIVSQKTPNSDDDIIYKFESGWFIRAKADEIELIIQN